ncbi:family with sequence similarity 47 member E [Rhinolophus ferrumequinum]|uniref:Family with sequence similarity 47 member E n=1 Tax=Rhinolophus ferrumequinum TaxID=59479 RepID=A0A7J8AUS9_RHIFE|nr:protein FAM47E-like [Rhinolophus ferrumequinum]KAF6389965.1 family with sequence similarity 47 member E [Rhinolophus ferrumequinum]
MEDKKWLLRPQPRQPTPLGMNYKPWYQDKLPSKCFAKHKNRLLKFPSSLDGRQWIFVKEGLDDFRTGCPPCKNLITRGPKEGFLPVIAHRIPKPAPRKSRVKLPNKADLFSTLSPAQQARKAFVEDIEASLTKHPLAHYPNLEEVLPADLLLKVLKVLDPHRKLEDTWAYCQGTKKRRKSPTKLFKRHPTKVYLDLPKETPLLPSDNWLLGEKENKKSSTEDILQSPPLCKTITRELTKFCRWTDTFGDLGIDEKYIMNYVTFDVRDDYKLNYDTGKIKKISQIPSGIKYSKRLDKVKEKKFSIQEENLEREDQKPQDLHTPSRVKMRYGAWYLKPKLWTKLINGEPLIDPKILLEAQGANLKPDILDDLYGTIAFKDFIVSKGYRMPEVLEKVFIRKGWTYDAITTPLHRANIFNLNAEGEDAKGGN